MRQVHDDGVHGEAAMSDLPPEAVYKAAKVHARCRGIDLTTSENQQALVPDELRWMGAAVAEFVERSVFVSLADVTEALRGHGSTACEYALRVLGERFGKSAPSVTPEGEQR